MNVTTDLNYWYTIVSNKISNRRKQGYPEIFIEDLIEDQLKLKMQIILLGDKNE
jgi:hypothetical protein